MSVLQKKPFIEDVISHLSLEEIEDLADLLDGSDTTPEAKHLALHHSDTISSADIGVKYVTMVLNDLTSLTIVGYLIYADSAHCALVGYGTNNLLLFNIDPVNHTYKEANEALTIEELRRVVDDYTEHGYVETDTVYAKEELEVGNNGYLGDNLISRVKDVINSVKTKETVSFTKGSNNVYTSRVRLAANSAFIAHVVSDLGSEYGQLCSNVNIGNSSIDLKMNDEGATGTSNITITSTGISFFFLPTGESDHYDFGEITITFYKL